MKRKDLIYTILITVIIMIFLIVFCYKKENYGEAREVYKVYLNGEKMGIIADDTELYNLINEEQKDIKEKYNVSNVYPPVGFEILKYTTYDDNITKASSIYDKIKNQDDFTIEGYKITIRSNNEEKKEIVINVLDDEVFKSAVKNVAIAFISEEEFNNYINNKQAEIVETGQLIEHMYFEENISINKTYISANDKIYTDENELSQFLLFGEDVEPKTYKINEGDTIASVSESNELNPQEFLISNPKFKSENSMLAIGEEVNIALINPQLTLVEELHVVQDVEAVLNKEVQYDNAKSSTYSQVTQTGVTGITRFTQKVRVVNGEQNQGVEVVNRETIREAVTEITVKGKKSSGGGYVTGSFVDTGGDWAWPTNSPYLITSDYAYRWGKMHDGIDISGTGKRSPIYAAKNGTVVTSSSHWSLGKYVVIAHENNYYTMYAHLDEHKVREGAYVTRGQVIGLMGNTGNSTGTHLHFSVIIGMPYEGGTFISPWRLYR